MSSSTQSHHKPRLLTWLRWAVVLTTLVVLLFVGHLLDLTQQKSEFEHYSTQLNAEVTSLQLQLIQQLRPLDERYRPLLYPEDLAADLPPEFSVQNIRVAYQDGTYRQLNRGNPHQQYRVTFDDTDAVSATILLTQDRIWQTYFLAGLEQDILLWPNKEAPDLFTISLFLPDSRQLILLDLGWQSLLPDSAFDAVALQFDDQAPIQLNGTVANSVLESSNPLTTHWQVRQMPTKAYWALVLPLVGLSLVAVVLIRFYQLHQRVEEHKIDQQEKLFDHLSDEFNLLMLVTDTDGTVVWKRGQLSADLKELRLREGDSLRQAWKHAPKALTYFQHTVSGETRSFEIEIDYFRLQVHQWPNLSPQGHITGLTLSIQDITEQRLLEEQIRHEQHHDALTGLPNRQLFQEQLHHELHRCRRREENLAVVALEVSGIGQINSVHGDAFSDQLLRRIAGELTKALREEDSLCRYSNDEFLMVISDFQTPEALHALAKRLIKLASTRYQIDDHYVALYANVGIATFPSDARDEGSLITCAITAMRHARQTGRNTLDYFSEESARRAQEKWHLERQMTEALAAHDFQLHYQPIFDLDSNRCIAAEALLRWPSTQLAPDQFIPVAEETGLIHPMGNWILSTAVRQWAQWHDEGRELTYLSVNISVLQLQQPGFIDQAISLTKQYHLPPGRLVLEITESILLQTSPNVLSQINRLRQAGYRLAIDDFGTGFSSLNYLKQLPIDYLKVDRSFVEGIIENNQDSAIYRAIVDMAMAMDIEIVAEGVETPQQMLWLKQQGVTFAQGYFYTQALPPEKFTLYLNAQSEAR
ncbi:putative bifunctional diguanylate cyclase/phosphodiesterase [Reinekea blandensis]|uniref:Diguanylate cyclase/phosphodiesterase (GGDEF & EAL domains) with PAS/PAC sensor(S) n=1 Tax=Reinekea blandensis MED297 TaxID=314283 RepID=A4BFV7_9GAMM|nr:bifunctional diguanylate cyclase/phosphodiesterase [Reinekea blandensis]EAR08975.1 diguanylate cyclase/phosphodiesterase (GGDEF & EAL domains) with PAS/PAC sensor(s) [Reinekea sp. MED297] [Reinekea blandensis MED297]